LEEICSVIKSNLILNDKRYLTFAVESVSRESLVAAAGVAALGVGAGGVGVAAVLAGAAFVVFLAIQAVHPLVAGEALALVRAQGVFTHGVGAAEVARQTTLLAALVHV